MNWKVTVTDPAGTLKTSVVHLECKPKIVARAITEFLGRGCSVEIHPLTDDEVREIRLELAGKGVFYG